MNYKIGIDYGGTKIEGMIKEKKFSEKGQVMKKIIKVVLIQ